MIIIQRKEDCVGCGACLDICPKDAISFKTDREGFWYPEVNKDKCINCGLCEKACPIIHAGDLNKTNSVPPTVYASFHNNKETRFESTTGGLFSALAEKMLQEGGYIGGAVWNDDFSVKHIVSNDFNDLKLIRGSKYLQSHTEGIYNQIRLLLKAGEKILVCGTPCQMAALRSFLGKDYANLLIVDFICCCISSPKVFKAYLDNLEKQFNSKIVKYHPKNKEYGGWHRFAFKATFENGEVYVRNGTDDDFTHCFIGSHVASRPCCSECRFKKIPRIADITIADFWGIENFNKEMDSPNGTSAVLINNEKGRLFYSLLGDTVTNSVQTLKQVKAGNANLYKSIPPLQVDKERFYNLLETQGFSEAVRYSRNNAQRVPLIIRIKLIARELLKRHDSSIE